MKPGYKTTEFWLSALAMVVALLYASGAISPTGTGPLEQVVAIGASILGALGYSVSRGLAKAGELRE